MSLVQFCIAQHVAFSAADWLHRGKEDATAVCEAASYLSRTSWYGYEDALEQVVEEIRTRPGCDGAAREQAWQLDLQRFSVEVRSGVARHRNGLNRRQRARRG